MTNQPAGASGLDMDRFKTLYGQFKLAEGTVPFLHSRMHTMGTEALANEHGWIDESRLNDPAGRDLYVKAANKSASDYITQMGVGVTLPGIDSLFGEGQAFKMMTGLRANQLADLVGNYKENWFRFRDQVLPQFRQEAIGNFEGTPMSLIQEGDYDSIAQVVGGPQAANIKFDSTMQAYRALTEHMDRLRMLESAPYYHG